MRRLLLFTAWLGLACTRVEAPASAGRAGPDTTGPEGHGGIAIEPPKPPAAPVVAARATPLTEEQERHVRELYLRAYTLLSSQPQEALRLLREVEQRSPGDSDVHQKAKARIAELEGR